MNKPMNKRTDKPINADPELVFVPLGGSDEIGMNLNLYGFGPPGDEDWLMVDFGITFGDGLNPGVDVIAPDIAFIEERLDRLLGLVITHAHEDHLGAMPYLWQRLRCPVYATPFAAAVLKGKLEEAHGDWRKHLTVVPLGETVQLGPFAVELIGLTHSIPEPNGLALRTPLGTVFHTGDWKFDPDPVIGAETDHPALAALGDEGVLAVVGDSTNVFVEGESGSEGGVRAELKRLIENVEQCAVVCCFASNVARVQTIAEAAHETGRSVVLAGRSLKRMTAVARETGHMDSKIPFLPEEAARDLPRAQTLILATGSQGESRAALARMASGDHPRLHLNKGDTVIFSSREIPGNEKAIGRMQNMLARMGVDILTWRDADIHVSGHPARDELSRMYQILRPKIAVPVHGEARHLYEHAKLARACQVPETVVPQNGAVIRLAPGPAETVGQAPSGYLFADGNRMIDSNSPVIRDRMKALLGGVLTVTAVVDNNGELTEDLQISAPGLIDAKDAETLALIDSAIEAALDKASRRMLQDDDALAEHLRRAVSRTAHNVLGKRPLAAVHLVRVE
ncbi:MAG: ribonuclease J [Rhodospirillales bacterium]